MKYLVRNRQWQTGSVGLIALLLVLGFNNCAPSFRMNEVENSGILLAESTGQPFENEPEFDGPPESPVTPPSAQPNPAPPSAPVAVPPAVVAPAPAPIAPSPVVQSNLPDVELSERVVQTETPKPIVSYTDLANHKTLWGKSLQVDLRQSKSLLQINPVRFQLEGATWNNLPSSRPVTSSVTEEGDFLWYSIVPGNYGNFRIRFLAVDNQNRMQRLILPVRVLLPSQTPTICENAQRPFCQFLQLRWTAGAAAGHLEDFYFNQDSRHSLFNIAAYSKQLRPMPNGWFAGGAPPSKRVIVGNASSFVMGESGGNLDRVGAFAQMGFDSKVRQMRENSINWYPAHTDMHGPYELFHYNGIFSNNTIGSSGSDLPEVERTFIAMAALRPDVKARLMEEGYLLPVVQMLMRRSRVNSDAEYFTGAAHAMGMFQPPAESREQRLLDMAQRANAMTMENIPPIAQITVVQEDFRSADRETMSTNPWGIHRIWRRDEMVREVVLSAESSFAFNQRPVTFRWEVLRGGHAVKIQPLDPQNKRVKVTFTWHSYFTPEFVQPGGYTHKSIHVDVGLFASNGDYVSAPAMYTVATLSNETRRYDNTGKLIEKKPSGAYIHPALK